MHLCGCLKSGAGWVTQPSPYSKYVPSQSRACACREANPTTTTDQPAFRHICVCMRYSPHCRRAPEGMEGEPSNTQGCCVPALTLRVLNQADPEYAHGRALAFVHDMAGDEPLPIPDGSLDICIMIFVLSAIRPSKFPVAVAKLVKVGSHWLCPSATEAPEFLMSSNQLFAGAQAGGPACVPRLRAL